MNHIPTNVELSKQGLSSSEGKPIKLLRDVVQTIVSAVSTYSGTFLSELSPVLTLRDAISKATDSLTKLSLEICLKPTKTRGP